MGSELKPCPFCGGHARVRKWDGWPPTYAVVCMKCQNRTTPETPESIAVEAWNQRALGIDILHQALRDAVAALGGIRSDNVPQTVRDALISLQGRE